MAEKQRAVFIATHAGEDPEKATIPFVMANAALASDMEATVILQSNGVWMGVRGHAEHIRSDAFPPLTDLIRSFMEAGGKMYVCAPCIKARGLTEGDLVDGAKVVAAATVIAESARAVSTFTY